MGGGTLDAPLETWLSEANRVYRLLRLGVRLDELGYPDGLPALLAEQLLAVDDVWRAAQAKAGGTVEI